MLTSLLVIVVIIFISVRQNNRIDALEKIIKDVAAQSQNGRVQQSQPSSVQAAPVTGGSSAYVARDTSVPAPDISGVTAPPAPVVDKRDEASSGRLLGTLGVGAVLVGVALFLNYAFDNNWITEAGRVMLGIIAGIGFLGVGQFLRSKYIGYSDLLMGAGSAILYLSIFSAYSFYSLISAGTASVFMLMVTALTLAISVVNATIVLSLVGIIGAYATPFLIGIKPDSMFVLFAYMTIINLGVLGISFFKKWPQLNVTSFIGTALNFIAWYVAFYNEPDLFPTLVFCVGTFLIFLVASIARGIAAGVKADQLDYILLGANAAALAGMGYILLEPRHSNILGFAAASIAVIYIGIAYVVNKRNPADTALNIFLPGLAVTFLSLAVPMQFSGPWIAVAWLIEACFLYGIASVISNRGFQVMGVVVYFLGLADFFIWHIDTINDSAFVPVFNTSFVVLMLAVGIAYGIAYIYNRFGSINVEIQKRGIIVFVIIAQILSIYALSSQIVFYHSEKVRTLSQQYQLEYTESQRYSTGYDMSVEREAASQTYYEEVSSTRNQSNTLVSILWTLYAAALTGLGFARRISSLRRLGLILFMITALKVFVDVWSLGQIYRIVSFIVFGIIALVASFGYVKYKDRLKDIV